MDWVLIGLNIVIIGLIVVIVDYLWDLWHS